MIARLATRYALVALIGLAVIGLAKPAAAEAPQPSPASLLIAKQIVQIKGVGGMFETVIREQVERARQGLIAANLNWTNDINEAAGTVYRSYSSRGDEFLDGITHIYASHFTEAELKDVLAYYQSPLGKKMLVEEPKVFDEALAYSRKWGESITDDVMTKMRAELKKRGHNM